MLGESCASNARTSTVKDYRQTMACYLLESFRMIQRLLSEADFKKSVPHVFGQPTDDNVAVSGRNDCALLIRKAQMHVNAVLRANKDDNLHSLAVHMRVVLECAAQVLSKAHLAYEGSPKELKRILNTSEYDFRYAMASLSQGSIDSEEIQDMIVSARERTGNFDTSLPKRVTISDKIRQLHNGSDWYNHLSRSFCSRKLSVLAGYTFFGGVTSFGTELDEFAFATLLDYLAEQVISMLFGYGFLLIAINGDSKPFDEAQSLLDRKRSATQSFRNAS